MKVRLWGTRGSLASPGAETARYGGNTACVEVLGPRGTVLILDAGTGIRRLAAELSPTVRRLDILLTHLHMDHIQGLGFYPPLHDPEMEIHIWGPASTTLSLGERLRRYLSPPLFPVRLRDLRCRLVLHEVPSGEVRVGELTVTSALVTFCIELAAKFTTAVFTFVPVVSEHVIAEVPGPLQLVLPVPWTIAYRIPSLAASANVVYACIKKISCIMLINKTKMNPITSMNSTIA